MSTGFFDNMKNSRQDIIMGSETALYNKPVSVSEIISRVSALENKVHMLKAIDSSDSATWDDHVAYTNAKEELERYLIKPYYPA